VPFVGRGRADSEGGASKDGSKGYTDQQYHVPSALLPGHLRSAVAENAAWQGGVRESPSRSMIGGGGLAAGRGEKRTRFRVTLARSRIDTLQHRVVIAL